MNVGFITASISRKAGGIMDSVRRMSQTLAANASVRVKVFGLRDEFSEEDRPLWEPLRPSLFSTQGPIGFGYAPGLRSELRRSNLDLVHTQGLWMYPSAACVAWSKSATKPHLVTPHGMLDPWALRRSRWKKHLAGLLFENAHLRKAACLHALTPAEAQGFRSYGLRNPICIVPNGIDVPDSTPSQAPPWEGQIEHGSKVLLYLGRLHPKKNLPALLRAWQRVRRHKSACDWNLVIAGWDQQGHEAELRRLASELGIADQVHFVGACYGETKSAAYYHADSFVLPSLSEGLPMVILEAWAHGLPVLMTKECNLPEGFEHGAAIAIEPESDSITAGLEMLFEMKERDLAQMGARGRRLVAERFAWPAIAAQMRSVYQWVLGGGPPPACVMANGSHPTIAPKTRPADSLSSIGWRRGPGRGGALRHEISPLAAPSSRGEEDTKDRSA